MAKRADGGELVHVGAAEVAPKSRRAAAQEVKVLSLTNVQAEMAKLGISMTGVAGGTLAIAMFNCLVKRLYDWNEFTIRIAYAAVCSQYFFGVNEPEAWASAMKTLKEAGVCSAMDLYNLLKWRFELNG